MPFSNDDYKLEVQQHLQQRLTHNTRILDVGAGSGTYGKLLKGYDIEAVEIWRPYYDEFKLHSIYKKVYCVDIRDVWWLYDYDYIILGDVLEHLSVEDATGLLHLVMQHKKECLVAVPYEYGQGAINGNEFERHLQPDLTPYLMLDRYPMLRLLYGNEKYGYYVNYPF